MRLPATTDGARGVASERNREPDVQRHPVVSRLVDVDGAEDVDRIGERRLGPKAEHQPKVEVRVVHFEAVVIAVLGVEPIEAWACLHERTDDLRYGNDPTNVAGQLNDALLEPTVARRVETGITLRRDPESRSNRKRAGSEHGDHDPLQPTSDAGAFVRPGVVVDQERRPSGLSVHGIRGSRHRASGAVLRDRFLRQRRSGDGEEGYDCEQDSHCTHKRIDIHISASVNPEVPLRSLVALLALAAAACGDGDDPFPPRDPAPIRVQGTVTFDAERGEAVVALVGALGDPVRGAAVWLLDGDDERRMEEWPASSGFYRLAPGSVRFTRRYAVHVASALGDLRTTYVASPGAHEIVSPGPFSAYPSSGFEVAWTERGSAMAARVRLSTNDYDRTDYDDGDEWIPESTLDQTTSWEYVSVERWNEAEVGGALPGSSIRVEVIRSAGPFAVQ